MAKSSKSRSSGVLQNYLIPSFGKCALRNITTRLLQEYFTQLAGKRLAHESQDKIRDVMSAVLRSAVDYGLLILNPIESVRMPRDHRGRRVARPYLTPQQFEQLITEIAEPYATMVYAAIYTGLRVSELVGLRCVDIHENAITIDECCCRGDWDQPKSEASNATIAVNRSVIERINRLRALTVEVCGGGRRRKLSASIVS